ncbi:MAG TPA: PHP domain-containing protein [Armatimonadota bacterium]|jgi:hypothetical protein
MLERKADLHVHTTASDGRLTPEAVVIEAASVGLAGIAITDHDTIHGIRPAMEAGLQTGVTVVPGVEINTDYGKDEIHMLGYYIDMDSPSLNAHLETLRSARLERGAEMVKKLNALGLKLSMERVLKIAGKASIGRPHIARAIVEAGYAGGMNGAFGKYLVRGAPGYVPRLKLSAVEAIHIILEAGGVAVMAHPGNSKHDELIPELVSAGMQGIEAAHTDHSSAQRRHYLKLARKYGLLATGGSDYHGPDMMKMAAVGHVQVDMDVVTALRELAVSTKSEHASKYSE